MAKRMTDTEKWDSWFRGLTSRMRTCLQFLNDKCNHAGIWKTDFEMMNFMTGETFTPADMELIAREVVKLKSGNYQLLNFTATQYGKLDEGNRVHKSVIEELKKEGLWKPLINPIDGDKDKDKAQDQDKEKDSKGGAGENPPPPPAPTVQALHHLILIWNEHATKLSKVAKSNKDRDKKIAAIFAENTPEEWIAVVQRINKSSFCRGEAKNSNGWKATFDWLLQRDTHLKVTEGKYDDGNPTPPRGFSGQRNPGSGSEQFPGF